MLEFGKMYKGRPNQVLRIPEYEMAYSKNRQLEHGKKRQGFKEGSTVKRKRRGKVERQKLLKPTVLGRSREYSEGPHLSA
jgi:hypothetical protein